MFLADVARGAAISVSMLSQIERGVVSPSLDTLFRVCETLQMDIGELLGRFSSQAPVRIFHAGSRLFTENGGTRYERLVTSPDTAFAAEMFLLEVPSGGTVGLHGRGHEGVEMGYVLRGSARLTVGDKTCGLVEGDSVSFLSHLPHTLENSGDGLLRAVWSVLPPHKDYFEPETTTN